MEAFRTVGEVMTPYLNQTLEYFGTGDILAKAMQKNPIEFASKWMTGLGSVCLAMKTFSMAKNSESTTAKVSLYSASLGFAAITAYEVTAALYGRVSFEESYLPSFAHDEL